MRAKSRPPRKCTYRYCDISITKTRATNLYCSELCKHRERYLRQKDKLTLKRKAAAPKQTAKYIGYIPTNWQKEVRKSNARFKVIVSGRRSGKTHYVTFDEKDVVLADLIAGNRKVWIV